MISGPLHEILFDRMKTAVVGENPEGLAVYNRSLLDLARQYAFHSRARRPYRANTDGKIERAVPLLRVPAVSAGAALSSVVHLKNSGLRAAHTGRGRRTRSPCNRCSNHSLLEGTGGRALC